MPENSGLIASYFSTAFSSLAALELRAFGGGVHTCM